MEIFPKSQVSSHELLKSGEYLYLNVAEGGDVKGSPRHKPQQIHWERHLPQHENTGYLLPPTPRNLLLPLAQDNPQQLGVTPVPPFSRP